MKNKLFLFHFIIALVLPLTLKSQNVPDANFRAELAFFGVTFDGLNNITNLPTAQAITTLFIGNKGISDLTGVEFLTGLITLNVEQNSLTSLNVSGLTNLQSLVCQLNPSLATLDITGCASLQILNGANCDISTVTGLPTITSLVTIQLNGDALTALDVSNQPALYELTCTGNPSLSSIILPSPANSLTILNVSETAIASVAPNAPILNFLFCGDCPNLLSVNVSQASAITVLLAFRNPLLTSLDVSNLTILDQLSVGQNSLTALDVSNNLDLTQLFCSQNNISTLNLSANTKLTRIGCNIQGFGTLTSLTLPAPNDSLRELSCGGNSFITTLDVSGFPNLEILGSYGTGITSLDLSANTALVSLDGAQCPSLTTLTLPSTTTLTSIQCWDCPITALDVSANTALTYLDCRGTSINYLDVASNTALTTLDISGNPTPFYLIVPSLPYNPGTFTDTSPASIKYLGSDLEVPDANFRTALIDLGVTFNLGNRVTNLPFVAGIDSLNVHGLNIASLTGIQLFTGLTSLNCGGNLLTSLDVSNNTLLSTLSCQVNSITSLDLSVNTALIEIYAQDNDLTMLTLPATSSLLTLFCSGNSLTMLDVSANPSLLNLRCASNAITTLDVSLNSSLTYLDCSSNALTALTFNNPNLTYLACGNNNLTALDPSTLTALNELRCPVNSLTSLDVSFNTALTYLDFGENPISAIDVSMLSSLTLLYGNNTDLTTLDLAGNPNLITLRCFESNISSLNLTGLSALSDLRIQSNAITTLNLTDNIALQLVDCSFNALTSLTLPSTTTLTNLICNNNPLTTLDISPATGLIELACFNNQLTDLNITANTVLESLDIQGNPTPFFLTVSALPFPSGSVTTFFDTDPVSFKIGPREIPDANFRTALTSYGVNFDGLNFITNPSVAATITNLSVPFSGIVNTTGLEAFVRADTINISNNLITTVVTSGNPFLKVFDCSDNDIASLDISANTQLKQLYVYGNQLTSLNLQNDSLLTHLNCSNNQINILNTGNNPLLDTLIADFNPLAIVLTADPAPSFVLVDFGTLTDFLRSENLDPTITVGQTGGFIIGGTGAILRVASNSNSSDVTLSTFAGPNPTVEGSLPFGVTGISLDRYWIVNASIYTMTFDLIFDLTPITGVTNINTLQLLRRDDEFAFWENVNDYGYVNFDFKGNYMIAKNMSLLGEFAIGTLGDNPLPVELTSFTAKASETKITLQWATASERDNQGFVLKRALAESGPYEMIADFRMHPSLRGVGNSSAGKSYQYEDQSGLKPGTLYHYKIYDVSYSGVSTEHTPISVRTPYQFSLEQNFPNPFNPATTIRYQTAEAGSVVLKVYDILGREVQTLVNERKEAGQYEARFNASSLASGIYFYTIRSGSNIATKKMMLLK